MSTETLLLMASGAYRFVEADRWPTFGDRTARWTAYVVWNVRLVEDDGSVSNVAIEEIDVEAATHAEAWRTAAAAVARDFEPGGVIRVVEERVGLYS